VQKEILTGQNLFMIGAALSAIAALCHLACIYFGASWYRFFGAGEQMAIWAEQGNSRATLITLFITAVLFTWSLYALSASGIIMRLPFLKFVLLAITAVYIFRGVVGFYFITHPIGRSPEFWFYSSLICLIIGIIHFVGYKKVF
jgi:hypothetical protein